MSDTPVDGDDETEGSVEVGEGEPAAETDADEAVTAEEVRHVAELARIDLDEAEVESFAGQFAAILEYFDALDEVPEVEREADLVNVMRPDEVRDSLSQEEALANAPATEDGYFKGPRVS